ncbi:hypothetical protein [Metabacillus iocasae]|uniref:Membrane-associated HD superfamily phosphohydrolase n=1 Tax=Priestia iocasae TaxID=2291674 RepID=A0ABS2QWG1_9BACI|nr:hypothetical protein [Metabacillus iocasae]MBM7703815.1 membrane-associated HD superfamily phosphohydrolase [Metabacillus iocasae]
MIWFTVLIVTICIIRPYIESISVRRIASERKKVSYYKEQSFFYALILLFFVLLIFYFNFSFSTFGWNSVYFQTIQDSHAYPAVFEYLLLLGFVGFLFVSFMIGWMSDHGERVFLEQELPMSVEATVPTTKKERSWWFTYSGVSGFVESVVYFPAFFYFFHTLLLIQNNWLLAAVMGLAYFMSQLAFQRDRLSFQTFLVGTSLSALYIMTNSIIFILFFYALSFLVYDVYQDDLNYKGNHVTKKKMS